MDRVYPAPSLANKGVVIILSQQTPPICKRAFTINTLIECLLYPFIMRGAKLMATQYLDPRVWVEYWEVAFERLLVDWREEYTQPLSNKKMVRFAGVPFMFLRKATLDETIDEYPDDKIPIMPVTDAIVVSTYCSVCNDMEEWLWLWPELFFEGKRRCCGLPFVFNPLMLKHYMDVASDKPHENHIISLGKIHNLFVGSDGNGGEDRAWAGYGAAEE